MSDEKFDWLNDDLSPRHYVSAEVKFDAPYASGGRDPIDLSDKIDLLRPDAAPLIFRFDGEPTDFTPLTRRERFGFRVEGARGWLALKIAPWLVRT